MTPPRSTVPPPTLSPYLQRCKQVGPFWLSGKESACNTEDPGSIPGSGRSPGGGNGNPLQYLRLENPKDGGAWRATVYGVTKSVT